MTTPQPPLSRTRPAPQRTLKEMNFVAARSIYCADCLYGKYFEAVSTEWICPDCQRHIVLDWGHSETEAQNYRAHNHSTTTEAP